MNGPIKLECYTTLGWKSLQEETLQLTVPICKLLRKKFCDEVTCSCIHNTSFSLQLMKGPIRQKCYITIGRRGLQEETLQLFGPICKLQRKKFYDKVTWSGIHNTLFSSQLTKRPIKLECYTTLGWKSLQEETLQLTVPICKLLRKKFCDKVTWSDIHNT